ncbi:hypothetical protein IAT38_000336 [Cryptococcus sp. DSM 104549]
MFSLPAFLTDLPFSLPFPSLPLPSIPLPANIQRRFLSYVLKRTLGRFVKHGPLDPERIQAQVSEGWVEIEGLEVEPAEINAYIPPNLPLTLTSGTLSKLTARVPLPNLWSDPLCLTLDELTLDFTLDVSKAGSPTAGGKRKPAPGPSHPTHQFGLDSVTSAADDFLHNELDASEELELEGSIRQSLVLSGSYHDFPGAFPSGPPRSGSSGGGGGGGAGVGEGEHFQGNVESTTVLAGLVERILARLEFKVNNVRVRIRFDGDGLPDETASTSGESPYEGKEWQRGVFELRIAQIRYADESTAAEGKTKPEPGSEGKVREEEGRSTTRAVRISNVGVYLLPIPSTSSAPTSHPRRRDPPETERYRAYSRSSSASSASADSTTTSSSGASGEYADMAMSQAVADLRESTAGLDLDPSVPPAQGAEGSVLGSTAGGSVYQSAMFHSALSEQLQSSPELPSQPEEAATTSEDESDETEDHAPRGRSRSRSATPTPGPGEPKPATPAGTLLLSFGSDDIVLRMKTTRPLFPASAASTQAAAGLAASPTGQPRAAAPAPPAGGQSSLPSVEVDISVGTITALLFPRQLALVLAAAQAAASAGAAARAPEGGAAGRGYAAAQYQQQHRVQGQGQAQVRAQPQMRATTRIKAFFLTLVYDMSAPSHPPTTPTTTTSTTTAQPFPTYWSKPSSTYIPIGHLRLRLEGMEAKYASHASTGGFAPHLGVGLQDASVFEYLASATPATPATPANPASGEEPAVEGGAEEDAVPGGAFPVLLFDAGLPRQYELAPGVVSGSSSSSHPSGRASGRPNPTTATAASGAGAFPEFDTVDWRNAGQRKPGAGAAGERGWKVKVRGRGILKGLGGAAGSAGSGSGKGEDDGPVVSLRKELVGNTTASVTLQPVHIFLDLSLVERLLPMLRFIAPSIRSSPPEPLVPAGLSHTGAGASFRHPYHPPAHQTEPPQPTPESIISSLSPPSRSHPKPTPKPILDISCPMLRLSIRCPAPVGRRGTWGDGGHLRSGIVMMDVQRWRGRVSAPGPGAGDGKGGGEGETKVEWEKMIMFFARAPDRRSSAFLVVGPLAPEPGDIDAPLPPTITLTTLSPPPPTRFSSLSRSALTAPTPKSKTTLLRCQIPSVQSSIRHRTIVGLQFFADDMTHWLDGAFGDGSAPKPRDELRMIGSKFFGGSARGSSEASSEVGEGEGGGWEDGEGQGQGQGDGEGEEGDGGKGMVVDVEVSEVEVTLYVPREAAEENSGAGQGGERVLALKASDVHAKIDSHTTARNEMAFSLTTMDLDFSDLTDPATPTRILGRTTPFTLTSHQSPILSFRFSSLSNTLTATKESNVGLVLSHFTATVHREIAWLRELMAFAKSPPGVFEDVVPSEVTRISLLINEGSLCLLAPHLPGGITLHLGSAELKTELWSQSAENVLEFGGGRVGVLAVDDVRSTRGMEVGGGEAVEVWKKAGWAQLAEVGVVEVRVVRDLAGAGEVAVDITQLQFKVTACADSLATFGELATDIGKLVPNKKEHEPEARSPVALEHSINVFGSLDEDAFNRIPDIVSGGDTDMIEDDLPHNLDYLDRATRHSKLYPSVDRVTGESLRAWETGGGDDGWGGGAKEGGETIKVLVKEGFGEEGGYWEGLPVLNKGYGDDARAGKTQIRLHNATVKFHLHDGYDWVRTRKTIEDEVRAVRRRLEKIRQLLASGQKADESIERATSSVLFNSVYIGLEQKGDMGMSLSGLPGLGGAGAAGGGGAGGAGGMDERALLAAIDEELDEMETASQSSWQTLPSGPGAGAGSSGGAHHKKTRLKGKRLTRSKRPQIEIVLTGVKSDVDVFAPDDETSSRVRVTVKEMEILDHIKTSTWKKFLTEMKADSRGNVRETDADMVRVELVGVRLKEGEEEMRLKAKVLPLRLHVDQDALDFLKRFFSFKAPPPPPLPTQTPAPPASATSHSKPAQPFFQHVEIFPIQLKLDYKPKRVDFAALREGKTIELMNFFHFDGAEMTLRHVTLSGITGWERLGTTLEALWTPDVKANQLADVISGVSPIRSVVNVGSGVADLILLPIEQYRKDGRLARGVQRGTNSFVKSTALEMMKLGARLATGTQVILEKAEGILGGKLADNIVGQVESSPGEDHVFPGGAGASGSAAWEGSSSSEDEQEVVSRYANQPEGVKDGVQAAYRSLSKNVNAAAQTILAVPMEVYERSGDDGPLRAVVRAVPIAVLKPMIGTTEAVSKTLLGMRNQLDPSARRELGDKYK